MTIAACPPHTTIQKGIVVFVPADFKAAYPEFVTVADGVLSTNFTLAELQLANTCRSRVINAAKRETLLNLLTAHITQLRNGTGGNAAGGLVGRVSEAHEGTVGVSADMGTVVYGQAYYMQTQWGAMYWQATAMYRTAVYVAAPPTCADAAALGPFAYGSGYGGYGGGGCGC